MKTIGINIENYRRKKRLSQIELSKLTGISRSYISEIESGKYTKISVEIICKICRVLDVTPNDIIPEEMYR